MTMGICIQSVNGNGPTIIMNKARTLARGWVWIVLRRDPDSAMVKDPTDPSKNRGHQWHIQGVATNEELALRMCLDENYVIGPLPLDSALSVSRIEWAGSYFP
jgi:hypothetical protein